MLNLNVGILGHVDSGKTSLAKALSTVSSTASFDKNPQSQERGITIDLGFSSLLVEPPSHLLDVLKSEKMQLTLVDCPGHASLIRTVIGGAQIIDMMMLVVDVTKGMQTQTAECLIIAEITSQKMVVVLNKIDMLPEGKKASMIEKMTKKLRLTLEKTIVFKDAPIVSIAANPGGGEGPESEPLCIQELIDTLRKFSFVPQRDLASPFLFCVDHCFSIRGQGTVMTGTVLQGVASTNDTVEIPALRVTKKIKSMQMFRKPLEKAQCGDRLGLCVTQFDPTLLERGIVCAPGYVPTIFAAIIAINKIKYFKGSVKTKAKFHISVGHETIMAKVSIFGLSESVQKPSGDQIKFDFDPEYLYQEELTSSEDQQGPCEYALLEFEKPVFAVPQCLVIGSKLDTDIHANMCRLAFHGRMLEGIEDKNYATTVLPKLKVFKNSSKEGVVERVANEYEVIGKNMFKKETNMQLFVGLKVELSTGESGIIESSFGQSGKIKVRIPDGLAESTATQLAALSKKKGKTDTPQDVKLAEPVKIVLKFKKYVYDMHKKIIQ